MPLNKILTTPLILALSLTFLACAKEDKPSLSQIEATVSAKKDQQNNNQTPSADTKSELIPLTDATIPIEDVKKELGGTWKGEDRFQEIYIVFEKDNIHLNFDYFLYNSTVDSNSSVSARLSDTLQIKNQTDSNSYELWGYCGKNYRFKAGALTKTDKGYRIEVDRIVSGLDDKQCAQSENTMSYSIRQMGSQAISATIRHPKEPHPGNHAVRDVLERD